MSEPLISPSLVPPGVNDRRSRDFTAAFSALLEGFQTSALLVQDPWAVDARLLPTMTVELGMSEFVTPGLLEPHIRALLAAAPDIHAMTGTVAGVRRALGAIGVTVDWVQWWQKDPHGRHDTHEVVAYVNDHLFAGQKALLTAETQAAVRRLIEATQRWSQDIDFKLGVGFRSNAGLAGAVQSAAMIHPAMSADIPMPEARLAAAATTANLALVHPSAVTAWAYPAASFTAAGGIGAVQFLSLTMEAAA